MGITQKLAAAAVAGAILAAPLAAAGSADAATPFSVTVLHCGGGIHIQAFNALDDATHALNKLVKLQLRVPHSLHKIQLREGDIVLLKSKKAC